MLLTLSLFFCQCFAQAFQSLASTGTDAFLHQLWAQRSGAAELAVPQMFSVQLCEHSGTVWMGGYDTASFKGSIAWTPLASETYWSVLPYSVSVGGTDLGFTSASWPVEGRNGGYNIIDSGTTLWELPSNVYAAVRNALIANPTFQKYFRYAANDNFFDDPGNSCEYATDSSGKVMTGAQLQKLLPTITVTFANGAAITMDGLGSYILPCTNSYNQFVSGIAAGSYGGGLLGGWPLLNVRRYAHHLSLIHI